MGSRFRLGRPTALAQSLRTDATVSEQLLWRHLRRSQLGAFKFSRQLPIAGYLCDFVCRSARLVVEIDGGQHAMQAEQDRTRTERIERAGYHVIRFWNNEVQDNIENVLLRILDSCAHPPAPSRQREGE
ncbi:MAG: endonuclease domain-containing protein [Sphingomonadaceae bacterium]|nr:endonuclease domain-containing protein [Sphingomonadaceae bacterium]